MIRRLIAPAALMAGFAGVGLLLLSPIPGDTSPTNHNAPAPALERPQEPTARGGDIAPAAVAPVAVTEAPPSASAPSPGIGTSPTQPTVREAAPAAQAAVTAEEPVPAGDPGYACDYYDPTLVEVVQYVADPAGGGCIPVIVEPEPNPCPPGFLACDPASGDEKDPPVGTPR